MIILVTLGGMLGLAVALGVVGEMRNRRSGRLQQSKIDAESAHTLIMPPGNHTVSEYLPPPDDGRPPH